MLSHLPLTKSQNFIRDINTTDGWWAVSCWTAPLNGFQCYMTAGKWEFILEILRYSTLFGMLRCLLNKQTNNVCKTFPAKWFFHSARNQKLISYACFSQNMEIPFCCIFWSVNRRFALRLLVSGWNFLLNLKLEFVTMHVTVASRVNEILEKPVTCIPALLLYNIVIC